MIGGVFHILVYSVGSAFIAGCIGLPMAELQMPMSTAQRTFFAKVSRTSISRDCVGGFWTAP